MRLSFPDFSGNKKGSNRFLQKVKGYVVGYKEQLNSDD
jgi:hypothetical protein